MMGKHHRLDEDQVEPARLVDPAQLRAEIASEPSGDAAGRFRGELGARAGAAFIADFFRGAEQARRDRSLS